MADIAKMGYGVLDAIIDERGSEYVHNVVLAKLAEGVSPSDIAAGFGMPYVVLRGWLEKNAPELVGLAGRARADELEWRATNAVDNVEPETVGMARLQSDHYMKVAGKLDRAKWGDKVSGDVSVGVVLPQINVTFVGMSGGVVVEELPPVIEVVEVKGENYGEL